MDDLLQPVYRAFAVRPLRPDEHNLYVDLTDARGRSNLVSRLASEIRLSGDPVCKVVAGHDGSGKSTELRRLQHDLETGATGMRFFVVYCEADEDIDRNDVDFPELLIAIVRQTAAQLKARARISLKPGYIKDRLQWLKSKLKSEITLDGVELGVGLAKLSASIKDSPDARLEVRRLLEPDTGN